MKRPISALVAITVSLSGLAAGCRQTAVPADADSRPDAAASVTSSQAPGAAALSLANATIVLPAVPGRPGAAYLTVVNRGDHPATLLGVTVAGADHAQMHQTSGGTMEALSSVAIPAGGSAVFAPGGRHVMVFGLPAALHAGGTATLTASFADGAKLSATATARAPGAAAADPMPGMKMD